MVKATWFMAVSPDRDVKEYPIAPSSSFRKKFRREKEFLFLFSLLLLWLFSRVSMRSSSHSSRMANKQTREDFLSQWGNTHWKYIHIDRLSDGNEAAALLRSLLLLFPLGPHPPRSPSAQSGWPPSSPPLESFFFSTVSIFFSFVEYFRPSSW